MIFSNSQISYDKSREAICNAYLMDEKQCVDTLLRGIRLSPQQHARIRQHTEYLVNRVRAQQAGEWGLNNLLKEYDLSSQEGVILLCLAEALLRIPDAQTADQLIRDKMARADWAKHLGQGKSLLVNAGTWGLVLTGRVVNTKDYMHSVFNDNPGTFLSALVARIGEPIVRAVLKEAMQFIGHQFVLGQTIEDAVARSQKSENAQFLYSYDMLGEAALGEADALHYFETYLHAIEFIAKSAVDSEVLYDRPSVSIKLSALHPRFEHAQRGRVMRELIPRVKRLAQASYAANIAMTIDAEEADRLDVTLDVVQAVLEDSNFAPWTGFGVVVQAYQKRAPYLIEWLRQLVGNSQRRITLRLVKGAYWDSEIKRAQELGLDGYPVFTRKEHSDVSYLACAQQILSAGSCFYPQFATHNAQTLAAVIEMAGGSDRYETQRLHGMGEALYKELLADTTRSVRCRVYAPVGQHKDLLPYLVRRLLENGSNTSFVNRITDHTQPIESILEDPVLCVEQSDRTPHPAIVLPKNLFLPDRINSRGINLYDQQALLRLQESMNAYENYQWRAAALINGKTITTGQVQVCVSPANALEEIGAISPAQLIDVDRALDFALKTTKKWSRQPVAERAACLDRTADLFQENTAELLALCVKEGGRCIPDALAELREAVDLCRYYASEARKTLQSQQLPGPIGEENKLFVSGRGVIVSISPWNFPLAIFCGQIAAALVTGNCVVAKPASQTPLTAYRVTQLFHAAGVPGDVLQLLPGSGSSIGARLVGDPRIAGVVFTGSTQTARDINVKLANRDGPIIPFIAETGGQNAMIVDSSALPEQVVLDTMRSAFNSAGQRCSALRVLFLQEEIADAVTRLLRGAMQEIHVDDPRYLHTDVGPVIDRNARQQLHQHLEKTSTQGEIIYQVPLDKHLSSGFYVGPAAVQIKNLTQLTREVFGPILHIIRFNKDRLESVISAINDTGYGLTLGIQTRIEEKARYIQERVRVGNVYINRNMIGAAVGVQPFGGEGLSGTGPKAGGPNYLGRFITERVVTNNIAAIGGNTVLLSLKS